MSFQTTGNYTWPIGYVGGFASVNPHKTVVAPSMGFRAGSSGVTVGCFAWADQDGILTNAGTTTPTGFVYRNQQAIMTNITAESTNVINAGFAVALVEGGDFYAKSATAASVGQAVYASTSDGSISTAAKGSAPSGTVDTGWMVAQGGNAGDLIVINGPNHTPSAITSSSTSAT